MERLIETVRIFDDYESIQRLYQAIYSLIDESNTSLLAGAYDQMVHNVSLLVYGHPSLEEPISAGPYAFTRLILSHDHNSWRAAEGKKSESWKDKSDNRNNVHMYNVGVRYAGETDKTYHYAFDFRPHPDRRTHEAELLTAIDEQLRKQLQQCCLNGKTTAEMSIPMSMWRHFQNHATHHLAYFNEFYAPTFNGGQSRILYNKPLTSKNRDWFNIGISITPKDY